MSACSAVRSLQRIRLSQDWRQQQSVRRDSAGSVKAIAAHLMMMIMIPAAATVAALPVAAAQEEAGSSYEASEI